MREPQAKSAVVSQEQQPFRVIVQPAHGEESRQRCRQEVVDAFASVRVVTRAKHARRFVECDVDFAFDANSFAGNGNTVFAGIDLRAECGDRLAVDGDFAGFDESLAVPPRAKTGFGKKLLETDEHYAGLVFGSPNTRWPVFQRPSFLRISTRSKRLRTLRLA